MSKSETNSNNKYQNPKRFGFRILNLDIVSNLGFRASKFKSGMSLIEVIISMFMIAVLLVFYASALNLVALSRKMRNENLAYHIANKQMEDLRNTAYSGLPASGSVTDPMLAQIPSSSGNFTVTDYAGFGGMKELMVSVSWNDGLSRQVVLKSLAGSGGLNP